MGSTERAVRFVLAVVFVIVGVVFLATGTVVGGILLLVAAVLTIVMTAIGARSFGDVWRRRQRP